MRQRVLLAMGLLLNPEVLILDEPTTALDILTQRSIIELLRRLKEESGSPPSLSPMTSLWPPSWPFVSPRCMRVRSWRWARCVNVLSAPPPVYPGLMQAVPSLTAGDSEMTSIPGSPPDLIDLPSGCKFHPRCTYASAECVAAEPGLFAVGEHHGAACFHWDRVASDRKGVERA